jgi:hypothetical protein
VFFEVVCSYVSLVFSVEDHPRFENDESARGVPLNYITTSRFHQVLFQPSFGDTESQTAALAPSCVLFKAGIGLHTCRANH